MSRGFSGGRCRGRGSCSAPLSAQGPRGVSQDILARLRVSGPPGLSRGIRLHPGPGGRRPGGGRRSRSQGRSRAPPIHPVADVPWLLRWAMSWPGVLLYTPWAPRASWSVSGYPGLSQDIRLYPVPGGLPPGALAPPSCLQAPSLYPAADVRRPPRRAVSRPEVSCSGRFVPAALQRRFKPAPAPSRLAPVRSPSGPAWAPSCGRSPRFRPPPRFQASAVFRVSRVAGARALCNERRYHGTVKVADHMIMPVLKCRRRAIDRQGGRPSWIWD
ncbi:hypothetical protein BXY39_1089 [Eilatimonas milleporae]|uniref:Uncharacterized protein n=1 Tax=Eilatimonas milleporae TaxID=911205 RepID=A0A3M0CNT9_9PROT|nr:hypothetical protein BXY39_1089 [Eilatimonas milleporae]